MRRNQDHRAHAPAPVAPDPVVSGFVLKAKGEYGEVWLSDAVSAEFDKLCAGTDERSVKESVRLKRHLQRFADEGPASLQAEAFKSQKKQKRGHGSVHIFAFKAFQYRIYGIQTDRKTVKCFVGLSNDSDKKQNKADEDCLKQAAKHSSDWVEGA